MTANIYFWELFVMAVVSVVMAFSVGWYRGRVDERRLNPSAPAHLIIEWERVEHLRVHPIGGTDMLAMPLEELLEVLPHYSGEDLLDELEERGLPLSQLHAVE